MINFQPLPGKGLIELKDSRIRSTNVYHFIYFNQFVRASLGNDIKKDQFECFDWKLLEI